MNTTHHIAKEGQTFKAHPGSFINKPLAFLCALALSPVWLVNAGTSALRRDTVTQTNLKIDALGRQVKVSHFTNGYMKSSAAVWDILKGKMAFVGASINHTLDYQSQEKILSTYNVLPGLTSLQDVHSRIGLENIDAHELMNKQLSGSVFSTLGICFKAFLNNVCFDSGVLAESKTVPLFGLQLNNVSMKRAVDWVVSNKPLNSNCPAKRIQTTTNVTYFINAHSINTMAKNESFSACLQRADALFADGSGVRLAAKSEGFGLVSNLNGTDMLPKICDSAAQQGKSIFLLGGAPGIAEKAAANLQDTHRGLKVAGTHHGFFGFDDAQASSDMVNKINESGADIVLVGFGSPHQEFWSERFAEELHCQSILAVGGLFDFYSGAIPRAPLLLREVGMEWVWRLLQEPKTKFKRYVIGTPEFLIRTYILRNV